MRLGGYIAAMRPARRQNYLIVIPGLALLVCVGWFAVDRQRMIDGGGVDRDLALSATLARSQLISGPPFWSVDTQLQWVYQPTPAQLTQLRRSCDLQFRGPSCVVSAYVDMAEGSYSVMDVSESRVTISKSYMSFNEAREIERDLKKPPL